MIVRLLHMRIRPERWEDWLRFTRDVGFPGMLAQPGCRAIRRLGLVDSGTNPDGPRPDEPRVDEPRVDEPRAVCILTEWDSLADLEQFRASEAMRHLSAAGTGLSIPPAREAVYAAIPAPQPQD